MIAAGKALHKHPKIDVTTATYRATVWLTEKRAAGQVETGNRVACVSRPVELLARIQASFTSGDQKAVLVAKLRQIQLLHSYSFISPHICVGKILPRDSLVFDIISRGNVQQLQLMISEHQVTLRDRDSRGTPFLHVREGFI